MGDLVAFLTARLAEDEATARVLFAEQWEVNEHADGDFTVCFRPEPLLIDPRADMWLKDVAVLVARHDPARVLREVAAKRLILAEIVPLIDGMDAQIHSEWGFGPMTDYESDALLRIMAAVYSDHPDYEAASSDRA
jgi:Family of unknown function (DUF6221)